VCLCKSFPVFLLLAVAFLAQFDEYPQYFDEEFEQVHEEGQ